MGKTKGPYAAEFPVGSRVRIAVRSDLEDFFRGWKYHHPLQPEQLEFGGLESTVNEVMFYHGGDEIYELADVPGVWHEQCLRAAA